MRWVLRICCVLIALGFASESLVTKRTGFRSPLNIPLNLSGNFGEFRSNHFHTGIDIKTQGREGLPVFACEDGFVSRIKISPFGYGNALYIDHSNGYTTVYAHLQSYNDTIAQFIDTAHYHLEKSSVDLYPNPNELRLSKGDIIGFSGNSGSSGGPHLHFEIRQTETEFPMNPLLWDFEVEDTRKPVIYELSVYPSTDSSAVNDSYHVQRFPTRVQSGTCTLSKNQTIEVSGPVHFGIHSLDFLDHNSNRCGIYSMKVFVDDEERYAQAIDKLDFESFRMMNAHLDYEQFKKEKKSIHRAFRMPYNKLPIYKHVKGNGSLTFEDESKHRIRIEVRDVHGNLSSLEFDVMGTTPSRKQNKEQQLERGERLLKYNQVNSIRTEDCNLFVPENRLYGDAVASIKTSDKDFTPFSDLKTIGNELIPIHDYVLVKMKVKEIPIHLQNKLVGVRYESSRKQSHSLGGDFKMGWLTFRTKQFGQYYVQVDTVAPMINLTSKLNPNLDSLPKSLRFKVTDDLSGIDKYNAHLNGHWVLTKWDPKSALMEVALPEKYIKKAKNTFEFKVQDERGNPREWSCSFE